MLEDSLQSSGPMDELTGHWNVRKDPKLTHASPCANVVPIPDEKPVGGVDYPRRSWTPLQLRTRTPQSLKEEVPMPLGRA
jgi:hypothetical protein